MKKVIITVLITLTFSSLFFMKREKDQNRVPNLHRIYSDPAMHHSLVTHPVIVIPGIMGSNLVHSQTGQSAWGVFHGDYLNPSTREGLQALALKPQSMASLYDYMTPVVQDGVLKNFEFKFLGLTLESKGYLHIMQTLGIGGFRDEALYPQAPEYHDQHFTCFQFGYDWRLSNSQNAQKLHEFILEKQKYLKKEIKARHGIEVEELKFNIVAHSMGGLLSRYYARYGDQPLPEEGLPELNWEGAKNINHLFLVSTPNSGSVVPMRELIEGMKIPNKRVKKFLGFSLDEYPKELLGTFPSVYELFPRKRHHTLVNQDEDQLDPFSMQLWKDQQWGLAGSDPKTLEMIIPGDYTMEKREQLALEHLEKCLKNAQQFQASLDVPSTTKPDHLSISLYAGDVFSTTAQLTLNQETGELKPSIYKPGDETVIRASVLANENMVNENPVVDSPIPFDQVFFIFKKHMAMTEDSHFADNLLFQLLQQ